jgi:hypothetical protein
MVLFHRKILLGKIYSRNLDGDLLSCYNGREMLKDEGNEE